MGLQDDPRVQQLQQKVTIEDLLTLYFKCIYGEDQIQRMKNKIKNILVKCDEKEELFEKVLQNNENEVKPFLEECLNSFRETSLNCAKTHTPETLLMLSKFFIILGDFRLASEMIWGCALLALQNFITDRSLKVMLHSHEAKRRFARALSSDIRLRFSVFEGCHSALYTNRYNALDVNEAVEYANEFIKQLREFELSDEKKKELEKSSFDY